jgi:Ig-like domain from next to BRCA1 gene
LKPLTKMIVTLLTASLILVGCSQPATSTQTADLQTAIAGTLSVMQTQINTTASQPTVVAATQATTVEPTQAPTSTLMPTPLPTATPVVQITTVAIPVSQGAGSTSGPSYRVGDVKALQYPSKTYINAGMGFTEIISITNVGTATWPANTKVISTDDNSFNLAEDVTIGQVVSNGQAVELHLNLKAPEDATNYTIKFMLETPDGKKFGVGSEFDQPFTITFYVR